MTIEKPLFLFFLLLTPLPFIIFRPRVIYRYSSFVVISTKNTSGIMTFLFRVLVSLTMIFFTLALSGISLEQFAEGEDISEGALICLIRDRSESMSYFLDEAKTKIVATNEFIEEIVAAYPKDKFCLIDFGRTLRPSYLLTDQDIMLGILKVEAEADMGGTEFTKPIERAINILYRDKSSTSKAIIMVSDGVAPIKNVKKIELARWMRAEGIIFMWIALNPNVEDNAANRDLYELIRMLGVQGAVFRVKNSAELEPVLEKIKSLPRGLIHRPTATARYSLERIFNFASYTCIGILGAFFLAELCIKSAKREGGVL